MLLWVRLAFLYIDHWEATPLAERAAKSGRSGAASAEQAAVRQLKVLLAQLSTDAATVDEGLDVELKLLDLADFLFKLMCGIHVPQLSNAKFTRLYLTAGNTPKPYQLSEAWLTRYCNPVNLTHLDKAIEGVASFNLDAPAPASNKSNATPTQPKTATQATPATAQQTRTADRENRLSERKAGLTKGERVQRLDPSRAKKPFVRRVVG